MALIVVCGSENWNLAQILVSSKFFGYQIKPLLLLHLAICTDSKHYTQLFYIFLSTFCTIFIFIIHCFYIFPSSGSTKLHRHIQHM
jgi:hypothetical protein